MADNPEEKNLASCAYLLLKTLVQIFCRTEQMAVTKMAQEAKTETKTMEISAVQMMQMQMLMRSMLGKFFYRAKVPGRELFFGKYMRADVLSVGDICMNWVLLRSVVICCHLL